MSKRYFFLSGVAVLTATLAGGWWLATAPGTPPPVAERPPASAAQTAAGLLVVNSKDAAKLGTRVEAAAVADSAPLGTLPAIIQPPANARMAVAATFPGVVMRTLVVEGDRVRRGQPLAIISSREILTLGSDLTRAHARAGVAQSNAARLSQLSREGIIAPSRADEARAIAAETGADVSEKARILRMVGGHGSGTYTLSAPIAGQITSATIQAGSPVDGMAAPYVIDAADRYEVVGQLPERLVRVVRPGMSVRIDPGITGRIIAVGSTIDPATRSALLKAEIPAAPGIVSGKAISLSVFGPAPAGAASVPVAAVTTMNEGQIVFVATARGFAIRKVVVGGNVAEQTVILSGLKPGERVVTQGTSSLKALALSQPDTAK